CRRRRHWRRGPSSSPSAARGWERPPAAPGRQESTCCWRGRWTSASCAGCCGGCPRPSPPAAPPPARPRGSGWPARARERREGAAVAREGGEREVGKEGEDHLAGSVVEQAGQPQPPEVAREGQPRWGGRGCEALTHTAPASAIPTRYAAPASLPSRQPPPTAN